MRHPHLLPTLRFSQVIVVVLLFVALLGVSIPLHARLNELFAELKREFVERLETQLDRPISYDRASPAVFRAIQLEGLTIHGRDGEPPVLLDVGRVRVTYSLWAVLRGEFRRAFDTLDLQGSTLHFQEGRDDDAIRFTVDLLFRNGGNIPRGLTVRGRDVTISYRNGDGSYRLAEGDFQVGFGPEGIQIDVDALAVAETTLLPGAFGSLESRLQVDASIMPGLEEGQGTVRLVAAETGLFRTPEQTFRLDFSQDGIVVRKVRDRAPLDLLAEYNRDSGVLEAQFEADGFVPANAVTLAGELAGINAWLRSPVSGQGSLRVDARDSSLSYETRIVVSPIHPRVPAGALVRIDAEGDEGALFVREARIDGAPGSAAFSGRLGLQDFGISGSLSLQGLAYAGYGPVSGRFDLRSTEKGEIIAESPALSYRRGSFFDLRAGLRLEENTLVGELRTALSPRGGSRVEAEGRIPLGAIAGNGPVGDGPAGDGPAGDGAARADGEAGAVSGSVRLVDVAVERAFRTLRESGVDIGVSIEEEDLAGFRVNARGSLSATEGSYQVTVPFVSLYSEDDPGLSADAALSLDASGLRVDGLTVQTAGTTLRGSVTAEQRMPGVYRIRSNLETARERYEISGLYRAGRSGVLRVNDNVLLRGYALRSGGFLFRGGAEDLSLARQGDPLRLSFQTTGVFRSAEDWSATLRDLRLEGRNQRTGSFVLRTNAQLRPEQGRLDDLAYRDRYSAVSGSGRILPLEEGYRLNAELAEQDGPESYELVGRWVKGSANGQVSFRGTSLRRLEIAPIRGSVSGQLSFQDVPEGPRLSVRLETEDASFNTDGFGASGVLILGPQTAELRDFRGTYLTRELQGGNGALDLATGKGRFELLLEDRSVGAESRVAVTVNAAFSEKALPLSFAELGEAPFQGDVVLDGVELGAEVDERWNIGISRDADIFTVAGGPGQAINGRVSTEGDFTLSLSAPLPLQFRSSGRLKAGELEATLTDAYFNVADLPAVFDFGSVQLVGGEARGSLRVVGPLNDPDFFGTFRAEGVEGEVRELPEGLGPADGFLVFEEKVLRINPLEVPVKNDSGGARFGGSATLQRWNLDQFRFEIETIGGQSIPVDYQSADLVAQGRAMGRLKVQGTPGITNVSGDLVVFGTSIGLGDPELAGQNQSNGITNIDLSITTEGRAEFLWPSGDLPVLRAFADRGETVRVVVEGNSDRYSVKGTVDVQGGEIYYFDRSFFIREGRIIFNESEEGFDPRLQARAEVREVARQGPVRIFLIVEEERLSNLTPRLESSPPLSTEEIVSILGQEFLAGSQDGDVSVASALLLPADVLQLAVLSQVEGSIRDALGLDLLSVRTQVLENVVAGAGGADEPLDSTGPSFGQYLNNTTLFLGKYVGSDLFLETLFEVGRTAPNQEALVNVGDVGFGAEIGIEWQTPFFLLNWSFAPRNPETLFVTDTTFELSWEFSY